MKTFYYQELNRMAQKNAVIIFGSTLDSQIPAAELSQSFDFNFKLYNRSLPGLSIKDAKTAFDSAIKPIQPEALIIHLGEEDLNLFKSAPGEFDTLYTSLILYIRQTFPKIRIALISLYNQNNTQLVTEMNRHIKAIADSEKCDYVNIDNARLWKPELTKKVMSFLYNVGFESPLNIKKPLRDIAEILYSYTYRNMMYQDDVDSCSA